MADLTAITIWAEYLESGNYPQATGALAVYENDDWSYCCLGVAALTAGMTPVDEPVEPDDEFCQFDGGGTYLPNAARRWLGLDSFDDNPVLEIPPDLQGRMPTMLGYDPADHDATAADLNDVYGFTFAEIARCVRYTYLRKD